MFGFSCTGIVFNLFLNARAVVFARVTFRFRRISQTDKRVLKFKALIKLYCLVSTTGGLRFLFCHRKKATREPVITRGQDETSI